MRLGIFSDTHANLRSAERGSRGLRKESIDVYYCLGDTVGYGGSPNECADLVRETAKSTILGNHDAAVAAGWTTPTTTRLPVTRSTRIRPCSAPRT